MIHYTCDRCRRAIDPEDGLRYVIHMDIRARMDGVEPRHDDDQQDHLAELEDILEATEIEEDELVGSDVAQQLHLDLCPQCYRRFIRNPLGQELPRELHFSEN